MTSLLIGSDSAQSRLKQWSMPLARRTLSSSFERLSIDARSGVHDRSRKLARTTGREDPIHDETVAQRE
ncbi:hypothetical protein [Nitrobacter sp.]|uniref:hypothetical protein n=1 Tax=Nitrobacter sp. TaxID=29420 RepID=UPI003F64FF80